MKTTLYIPDELMNKAKEYTGIKEKTALLKEALEALIREKAAQRIIEMGGTDKKIKPVLRNR